MTKSEDLILAELKNNQDKYTSGSELSRGLGISRAAVWKQIGSLRRRGYEIQARTNRGYRLAAEPDCLDRARLEKEQVHYYRAIDSTNLAARILAAEMAPGYSWVVAEEQLRGRGRLGRSWHSPPGSGLWFSVLLRPGKLLPAAAAPLTLAAAAILADSFKDQYDLPLKIKWPNDLILHGKKMGGILTELICELDMVSCLIVGVGLNINQKQTDFSPGIRSLATSARLAGGRGFNRTEMFLFLKKRLEEGFHRFFESGFAPFQPLWEKADVTVGREVRATHPGGSVRGTAIGISADGALLLEDSRGRVHHIRYGEISPEKGGFAD